MPLWSLTGSPARPVFVAAIMERAKLASAIVVFLGLASWVLSLGGLGSIAALACSALVREPIALAKCSRPWSWQFFVLFFELFVLLVAAAVTCFPVARFAVSRGVVGHYFTIATVLIMTSLNMDIMLYVW
jgi:hypothetical protein